MAGKGNPLVKDLEEEIVKTVISTLEGSKPMGFAFTAASGNQLSGNRTADGSLATEGRHPMAFAEAAKGSPTGTVYPRENKPMNFSGTVVEQQVEKVVKEVVANMPSGIPPMSFAQAAAKQIADDFEDAVVNRNPDESATEVISNAEVTKLIEQRAMMFAKVAEEKDVSSVQAETKPMAFSQAAQDAKFATDIDAEKGSAMNLSGVEVEEKDDSSMKYEDATSRFYKDEEALDPKGVTEEGAMRLAAAADADPEVLDMEDKGSAMNLAKAAQESETSSETGEHGSGMDLTGQNKVEEEIETEKQIATPEAAPDKIAAEPEKDTGGRRAPVEIKNLRSEKPGWAKGDSDYWSINEKDPYWQTEEGFEEAMNLYGEKPAFVKEPTLIYNPRTGEYEEVEQEEFVDLSRKVDPKLKKYF